MTLLVVVLFGAGALLIISSIEDVSITTTVDDIISGQIYQYDWTGAKGTIQQQNTQTADTSGTATSGGGGGSHVMASIGALSPDVGVAPNRGGWWNVAPGFPANVTQGHNPPTETGIDIGTPWHTTITAVQGGTVETAHYGPEGGNLWVKLPDGRYENYLHLDDIYVAQGQGIAPGQVLGISGGQLGYGDHPAVRPYSTGPHTEFGVYGQHRWANGQWEGSLDPSPLLAWLSSGGSGVPGGTNAQ